jgi:hypothetical protein
VTRLLVEMWWETREHRWRRPLLRGRVTELPDGPSRAFSHRLRLVATVLGASLPLRARRSGRLGSGR